MNRLFMTASVAIALAVVALCASPAPAAKGVKKTQEHHIRGKVVSVAPVKGAKAPHGTLTIHVTHHKHKKTQVAIPKGTNRTFKIDMTDDYKLSDGW